MKRLNHDLGQSNMCENTFCSTCCFVKRETCIHCYMKISRKRSVLQTSQDEAVKKFKTTGFFRPLIIYLVHSKLNY